MSCAAWERRDRAHPGPTGPGLESGRGGAWGLRPEEAQSREFLALDIGLPAADFGPWLQQVLSRGRPSASDLGAVNRRGKAVDLRVVASPLRTEGSASGLILLIDQAAPDQPIPGQAAAG